MTSTLLTATHEALTEIETMLDALHLALATPEQLDSLEQTVDEILFLVEMSELHAMDKRVFYLDAFRPGWNLSKKGKPLAGAALAARRRKIEQEFDQWFDSNIDF